MLKKETAKNSRMYICNCLFICALVAAGTNGILIKSLYTLLISLNNLKMFLYLKLSLCYDIFKHSLSKYYFLAIMNMLSP